MMPICFVSFVVLADEYRAIDVNIRSAHGQFALDLIVLLQRSTPAWRSIDIRPFCIYASNALIILTPKLSCVVALACPP